MRNTADNRNLATVEIRPVSRLGLRDEVFAAVDQCSFAYMFDPDTCTPNGRMGDGLIFAAANAFMIQDIRFVTLCHKLGRCDYWVTSGRWPDCAAAVAPETGPAVAES